MQEKIRCFGSEDKIYSDYHDNQWGKPVYDDCTLFEFLILEGAQAGLSWITILKRRQGYKQAFCNFDIAQVANLSDSYLQQQLTNPNIIRNKLKVFSARNNAQVALQIQQEFGSLTTYFWQFVDNKPIVNRWQSLAAMPATTNISDAIAKDLKRRGMNFVGSTIIYAFMQAVGLVDDHIKNCWINK